MIGAAQGLVLYLRSKAFTAHIDNIWIAGASCAALLAPAVALAEVSRMPARKLAIWFIAAAGSLLTWCTKGKARGRPGELGCCR